MTRDYMTMIRCHTGVAEEGMLAEWWRLETLSLPEMKQVMRLYKEGKEQKKALKKEQERDARPARAHVRVAGGGGKRGWQKKKRSPSYCRVVPPSP